MTPIFPDVIPASFKSLLHLFSCCCSSCFVVCGESSFCLDICRGVNIYDLNSLVFCFLKCGRNSVWSICSNHDRVIAACYCVVYTLDLLGIILLLILGYSDVASIFAADGLLASGTLSLMDVLVFMALIFVVLALTEEVGVLDSFQTFMVRHAKTPRMAETVSGVFTCIFCAIIGSGMSTIAFISPIVRNIMKPFHIARTRAANYIAGFASGISWMVPHGVNTLTALAVAMGTGVVGDDFTMLNFIPYNFFCIGLIVVYWAAILTGIGRKKDEGGLQNEV